MIITLHQINAFGDDGQPTYVPSLCVAPTYGNAMDFCRQLLDLGLIVNDSHGHTIRISPPLNINAAEIDFLVESLEKVLLS